MTASLLHDFSAAFSVRDACRCGAPTFMVFVLVQALQGGASWPWC